jgi:hypothetical protein
MKEIFDSIRVNVFERITSPLFGAFAVSWCAWNFSFLLVVFSNDMNTLNKLTYTKAVLYQDWHDTLCFCVGLPLLSAAFFIVVYPIPAGWCYEYWHRQQLIRKKLRDEIENATLLTEEESRRISLERIELKRSYETRMREQEQKIETLEKALNDERGRHGADKARLESEIEKLRAVPTPNNTWNVDTDAAEVMQTLVKFAEGRVNINILIDKIAKAYPNRNTLRIQTMLDSAKRSGLIDVGSTTVAVSELGRRYATDMKLI